ncbi:MAG: PadR family transcriptional regulator [Alphaproteobacteria bacterium]|nr:PadR family transcriptional regulator [Alphaproteobacteria bacterium]MCB9692038.1 PadR family transcriptional regulator [Alphaproteobacteria bacterium]
MSRSRTPFVVLGLLLWEPMSGYDLKSTIERTVGHFWQESYGQLYPTLKALHAEGHVTLDVEAAGARQRKVYAITPAGRAAFSDWLAQPHEVTPARNELLLKVFFASVAEPHALVPHLEAARRQAQERLEVLVAIREAVRVEEATDHQRRCWLLTVEYGIRMAEATIGWATDGLEPG